MAERLNALVLKTSIVSRLSRVRIPVSPPLSRSHGFPCLWSLNCLILPLTFTPKKYCLGGRKNTLAYFERKVIFVVYFTEASIACSTSSIISSICSIPTEILIKSSLTPAKAFCSGVNCLCNVEAG